MLFGSSSAMALADIKFIDDFYIDIEGWRVGCHRQLLKQSVK
jgi:hypothetical protein